MNHERRSVKLSEIVFSEPLYPRKGHDPALVQRYAGCMDEIEARGNLVALSTDLTLLDGRHRHLAYLKLAEGTDRDIPVFIYPVQSDEDKFALAVRLNSEHGCQLSTEDKRRCVEDLYAKYRWAVERIAAEVSVRKQTALDWTRTIRENEEKRENEAIFDLWMSCHTQEQIAAATGVPRQTITDKLGVLPNEFPGTKAAKLAEYAEDDWTPPLFDVWNVKANSNHRHYGNTAQEFVDNLLYTFTAPFDIVVDPFAGGGSTIDICKRRLRRYWVSDRKPIVERESEIRLHDVMTDGVSGPARWADVALVYLDPPYWKQAAGKYSDEPTDLANMPLAQFTDALVGLIHGYAAKLKAGAHVACIISPTQWPNEDKSVNYHDIDLACAVGRGLRLVRRVVCPYSTEQYNGTQVDIAKRDKLWMVLSRTMLVWQKH